MILIDGKKIRDEILVKVKNEVASLSFKPIFCDVLVGEDVVSKQYVNIKINFAKKTGILCHEAFFPANIKEEELIKEIEKINNLENICGLIIQLPLPLGFNTKKILGSIRKEIDVDCLNSNLENAPTGKAIFHILDNLNLDLENKNILVIGAGPLVGTPVAKIFEKRGLRFDVVRKETENKYNLIKKADIVISGAGDPNFIKGDMIKEGAVLIDAGTSESGSSVAGDVDLESVKNIAGYVSPVPGGVGPVTVAMLLNNVLKVAKK